MKVNFSRLRRLTYAALALAVLGVAAIPAFSGTASAYNSVSSRYVMMSSSASGTINDGTQYDGVGVSYEVGFTKSTTGVVQGIVVDFCSNSPIIGDTCTAPTGFTVGTPTVATSGGNNVGLSGSWTAASINSGRTLTLKNASGGSITGPTNIKFTLSTATNPTHVQGSGTFYAKVMTFTTDTAVDTWAATANGSSTTGVSDAGGMAMSTTNQITVTAKVQETLTFCVYTGANCAAGGQGVTLGDTNGVLSTSTSYVDKNTKYDLASNAANGVTVRFKGDTLKSGSNSITAIGGTAATSNPGNPQFGLCSYRATGTLLTIQPPYTHASCTSSITNGASGDNGAQFALDTNGTTGTTSTYGDDLATMAAGSVEQGVIAFIGNIGVTQAAGIYTSTLTFIATGTY